MSTASQEPRYVKVPVRELRALRRAWATFQDDDGRGYEPLGDAVMALLRRMAKEIR
jgi:hypothetical protein